MENMNKEQQLLALKSKISSAFYEYEIENYSDVGFKVKSKSFLNTDFLNAEIICTNDFVFNIFEVRSENEKVVIIFQVKDIF